MIVRHYRKTPVRVALLAATFLTAVLLGVASRQTPPADTYVTPGGRLLHCDQLYHDLQTAYNDQLQQNASPEHAAGLACRLIT